MAEGKGARNYTPNDSIRVIGNKIEIDMTILSPKTFSPSDKKNTDNNIKVGDILTVIPPDRYRKEGWQAEVIKISEQSLTYKLLDTSEEFTVTTVVLAAKS